MKNVTWRWFFGIILLLLGVSGSLLVIGYTIEITNALLFLHGIVIGEILPIFIIQLVITLVLSLVALRVSYYLFQKENGTDLKTYFSVRHLRKVLNNLPRFRHVITIEERYSYCENWRLSYYKTIVLLFIVIFFFSILLIIPFTYTHYYHNLYSYSPNLFLAIEIVYGISFLMTILGFMFSFFYLYSREYYRLSKKERLEIFVGESLDNGETLKRNKEGFIPVSKRKQMHMDLWIVRFLLRNLDISGFNKEEKSAVKEFMKNLDIFDRFLISADKNSFGSLSTIFGKTIISITELSQPQIFLKNYYELKNRYNQLRKDYRAQFDTNELFDINKELSWNRVLREFQALPLTSLITLILIILILILFLVQIFVYHSIQIPSFPDL